MSKDIKAHPAIRRDAGEPARLRFGARGPAPGLGKGAAEPRRLSIIEFLAEGNLPPALAARLPGESLHAYSLRTFPIILRKIEERCGPLPPGAAELDLELLQASLTYYRRRRGRAH